MYLAILATALPRAMRFLFLESGLKSNRTLELKLWAGRLILLPHMINRSLLLAEKIDSQEVWRPKTHFDTHSCSQNTWGRQPSWISVSQISPKTSAIRSQMSWRGHEMMLVSKLWADCQTIEKPYSNSKFKQFEPMYIQYAWFLESSCYMIYWYFDWKLHLSNSPL